MNHGLFASYNNDDMCFPIRRLLILVVTFKNTVKFETKRVSICNLLTVSNHRSSRPRIVEKLWRWLWKSNNNRRKFPTAALQTVILLLLPLFYYLFYYLIKILLYYYYLRNIWVRNNNNNEAYYDAKAYCASCACGRSYPQGVLTK